MPWTRSRRSFLPRLASSVSIAYALSKWSSIARLCRPVTKIISVRPAATASSTAYWISGLSTTGIISLGLALVAGRKRLPKPATGNTAFVIARIAISSLQEPLQARFVEHREAERLGLRELRTGLGPGHDVIGLLRHRAAHLPALREYQLGRRFPREVGQSSGQDEGLPCRPPLRRGTQRALGPRHPGLAQRADHVPVVPFAEKAADRSRHDRSDVRHALEGLFVRIQQRLERAEVGRQIPCRRLADVPDAQRIDEPRERRLLRACKRVQQVLRRLLGHPLEPGEIGE